MADAQVRDVEHDGLAALVSTVEGGALAAAREVRAHWKVLEEASASATVLPVRFGTVLESEDAVRAALLEPNAERLSSLLEELDGRVQLTVKGKYDEELLLRTVMRDTPAIAAMNRDLRKLPEEAGYYGRIQLGEAVAAEVDRLRAEDTGVALDRLAPLAVASRVGGIVRRGRCFQPRLSCRPRSHRRLQQGGRRSRARVRRAAEHPIRGPAPAIQLCGDGTDGVRCDSGADNADFSRCRWPRCAEPYGSRNASRSRPRRRCTTRSAIRQSLLELEAAREAGVMDEREIAAAEDMLIERLMTIRGVGGGEIDGRGE